MVGGYFLVLACAQFITGRADTILRLKRGKHVDEVKNLKLRNCKCSYDQCCFFISAVFRLAVSQPSSNPVFGQRADRLCARRLSLQRDQLQRAQRWKHDSQPHGYYNSLSNTIQSYNFPDCFVPQSTLLWTLARAARTTTRSHESHPCCQVLNPFTFQVWLLHKSDFFENC